MRPSLAYESWKSYVELVRDLERAVRKDSPLLDCSNPGNPDEVEAALHRALVRLETAKRLEADARRNLLTELDIETETRAALDQMAAEMPE